MIGGNVVGRVRPLRVARRGEGENGQSHGPTGCQGMLHWLPHPYSTARSVSGVSASAGVSAMCAAGGCRSGWDAFFFLSGLRSEKSHGIKANVGLSGAFTGPNVRLNGVTCPANVRSLGCDSLRH